MKIAALVSGGKDSCYAICECIAHGHEVICLVNLQPESNEHGTIEIDSFMYQSVANEGVRFFADALGIPIYQGKITGHAVCQTLTYYSSAKDEVEDLFDILYKVSELYPEIGGIASGAILSNYQRERVEELCERLNLISFAFLWQRNQKDLLADMIAAKINALIVKVAAYGLDVKCFLGKSISELAPRLLSLSNDPSIGLNPCGEGGEFETFTFDCPLFRKLIIPNEEPRVVMHSPDPLCPVAYLTYNGFKLKEKPKTDILSTQKELLAIESLVDIGRGPEMRRPFKSVTETLAYLDNEVPKEIHDSVAESVQLKFQEGLQKNEIVPLSEGLFPLTNLLSITRSCYGISVLSDYADHYKAIEMASKLALEDMNSLLRTAGLSLDHVVHCIVTASGLSLSCQRSFAAINRPFHKAFCDSLVSQKRVANVPPSRVCINTEYSLQFVSQIFPTQNRLLKCKNVSELTVINLVGIVLHQDEPSDVFGMRVRSWSHWAPCAIGPYSQAVRITKQDSAIAIGDLNPVTRVFYAGQIGLIPETNQFPFPTSNVQQSWLALRNMHRVMRAMEPNTWNCLQCAIAYATSRDALEAMQSHFHMSVCQSFTDSWKTVGTDDTTCFCISRVAWTLVTSLPRGASVEWQVYTTPSPPSVTVYSGFNLEPPKPMHGIYLIKLAATATIPIDFSGPVVPVIGFLDSKVDWTFVSLL